MKESIYTDTETYWYGRAKVIDAILDWIEGTRFSDSGRIIQALMEGVRPDIYDILAYDTHDELVSILKKEAKRCRNNGYKIRMENADPS